MFLREDELWPWYAVIVWSAIATAISLGVLFGAILCGFFGYMFAALIVLLSADVFKFIARNVK
jgi:hypothetical protein